jgi:hypothetical protein
MLPGENHAVLDVRRCGASSCAVSSGVAPISPSNKASDSRVTGRVLAANLRADPRLAAANHGDEFVLGLDLIFTDIRAEHARLIRPQRATVRRGRPTTSPSSAR